MKKLILSTLFALTTLFATPVAAQEYVAGSSASLQIDESHSKEKAYFNQKKEVIRKMLERNGSPMAEATDAFVDTCIKYELDCYLLPSIAGLESGFGKHIASGTHNPFGWGRGYIAFAGWDKAIEAVGDGLKNNYINRGATTIEAIGAIYAESPTWAQRVHYFKRQFEAEEEYSELYSEGIGIQL